MGETLDNKIIVEALNDILEHELAGVVRYSHYALMVFGYARIPIIKWFREQAIESLGHADEVGEWVTSLNGHPSLKIGKLLETHKHSIHDILEESLEHEEQQIIKYKNLLKLVENKHIALEEYARGKILEEETHINEVKKMMKPMEK